MPEGLDEARDAFASEIAPPSQPRDQQGRFVQTTGKPEPIFQPRDLEDAGDDAGPDPRYLDMERRAADGRQDDEREGQRLSDDAPRPGRADGDGRHLEADAEQKHERSGEADNAGDDAERKDGAEPDGKPAEGEPKPDAESGPKYEINVDGETREVTLQEALKGYVSEQTYQKKMGDLVQGAQGLLNEKAQLDQMLAAVQQRYTQIEEEYAATIPKEPADWNAEFKANPERAWAMWQNYQELYGRLNRVREERANMAASMQQNAVQQSTQAASQGWSQFLKEHKIGTEDEQGKVASHMRRTARDAGFNDYEISTIYDPRMYKILHKAAKYDNIRNSIPPAVSPDRGKALAPGAQTRTGNGQARGLEAAQRKLAASGKMDDAQEFFRQMLR